MLPIMKLVYSVEIEIPDNALASDVSYVLKKAWGWLRMHGWNVQVTWKN